MTHLQRQFHNTSFAHTLISPQTCVSGSVSLIYVICSSGVLADALVNRSIDRPESDAILLFAARQILLVCRHFVSSLFLWIWVTHRAVTTLQMIGQISVSWEGLRNCHGGAWDRELTRLHIIQAGSSEILSLPAGREWGWLYTAGLMGEERWAGGCGRSGEGTAAAVDLI